MWNVSTDSWYNFTVYKQMKSVSHLPHHTGPLAGGEGGWWPPAAGSWSLRRLRPRRSPSLCHGRSWGGQWSVLCEAAATTATSSHQSAVKVTTIFRGSQYMRKTPIFLVERGYQFFKTYQYIYKDNYISRCLNTVPPPNIECIGMIVGKDFH